MKIDGDKWVAEDHDQGGRGGEPQKHAGRFSVTEKEAARSERGREAWVAMDKIERGLEVAAELVEELRRDRKEEREGWERGREEERERRKKERDEEMKRWEKE